MGCAPARLPACPLCLGPLPWPPLSALIAPRTPACLSLLLSLTRRPFSVPRSPRCAALCLTGQFAVPSPHLCHLAPPAASATFHLPASGPKYPPPLPAQGAAPRPPPSAARVAHRSPVPGGQPPAGRPPPHRPPVPPPPGLGSRGPRALCLPFRPRTPVVLPRRCSRSPP